MSKLWHEVKKGTSIATQYVKEKTGVSKSEVNPLFESACEKYQVLNEQFTTFKSDLDVILDSAQKASKSGAEMTKYLQQADKANGSSSQSVVVPVCNFFENNEKVIKEQFNDTVEKDVMANFKEVLKTMDHLGELKSKRNKTALYVGSLKNDTEKYAKNGDSEKLTKAKIEYEQQLDTLNHQTEEFINTVGQLWQTKASILETAIQEFFSITYGLSRQLYGNVQTMEANINSSYASNTAENPYAAVGYSVPPYAPPQ
ncbi:hypothetical protein TVAG_040310 [Trichomonas vaginalis G3]|uniref:BAR domain-containing protein n=1 Tax=Trichomonas vaginalis (strain ATCC PRA-98 / G3) TaxID=412133 RepID=A2F1S6_TRIV3|nr:BAR/IMD domain-like family [Trichomonas vaginalis G3]EAY01126.1 hypothetical protein TVAG_040310 [Trichomonas vaginalis G3]KAI5540535.1 BAR/IMD domain-like family [Trichomonas vaginalis G3]|eukprot:XP_001313978.1 hypothetical protein [Trichomonas vaginalis G3]